MGERGWKVTWSGGLSLGSSGTPRLGASKQVRGTVIYDLDENAVKVCEGLIEVGVK